MKSTLEMKIERSCQNRYAKLRQYPKSVMGYYFLENEVNFNLDDHLNVIQFKDVCGDTCVNTETLTNLHCRFLNKTFPENISPWFFTLIEKVPQSTKM